MDFNTIREEDEPGGTIRHDEVPKADSSPIAGMDFNSLPTNASQSRMDFSSLSEPPSDLPKDTKIEDYGFNDFEVALIELLPTAGRVLGGVGGGVMGFASPTPGGTWLGGILGSEVLGQFSELAAESMASLMKGENLYGKLFKKTSITQPVSRFDSGVNDLLSGNVKSSWEDIKIPKDQAETVKSRLFRALDNMAEDAVFGSLFDYGGRLLRNAYNGIVKTEYNLLAKVSTKQLMEDLNTAGVEPTAGMLGGRMTKLAESVLLDTPTSSKFIHDKIIQAIDQTENFANRIAEEAGPLRPHGEIGEKIKTAAKMHFRQATAVYDQLYDKAFQSMPANAEIPVPRTEEYLEDLFQGIAGAKSESLILNKKLKDVYLDIITNANSNEGHLPLKLFRAIKSAAGEKINKPKWNKLYARLSRDMDAYMKTGKDIPSEAMDMYAKADEYFHKSIKKKQLLGKIMDSEMAEDVFKNTNNKKNDYMSTLRGVVEGLYIDETGKYIDGYQAWREFRAAKLYDTGVVIDGDDITQAVEKFRPHKAVTRLRELSPQFDALYDPVKDKSLRTEIERLIRISKSMEELTPNSGTQPRSMMYNLLTFSFQKTIGGVQSAAVAFGAPTFWAELLESPMFIRLLTDSHDVPMNDLNKVSRYLAKFANAAKTDMANTQNYLEFMYSLNQGISTGEFNLE